MQGLENDNAPEQTSSLLRRKHRKFHKVQVGVQTSSATQTRTHICSTKNLRSMLSKISALLHTVLGHQAWVFMVASRQGLEHAMF
jgi:hypothetical protein